MNKNLFEVRKSYVELTADYGQVDPRVKPKKSEVKTATPLVMHDLVRDAESDYGQYDPRVIQQ